MLSPVLNASNGDGSETETTSAILASVKEQVHAAVCLVEEVAPTPVFTEHGWAILRCQGALSELLAYQLV